MPRVKKQAPPIDWEAVDKMLKDENLEPVLVTGQDDSPLKMDDADINTLIHEQYIAREKAELKTSLLKRTEAMATALAANPQVFKGEAGEVPKIVRLARMILTEIDEA